MQSLPAAAVWAVIEAPRVYLPIVDVSIQAGFPSPADDFAVKRHDLNELLITHPQATFFWRVAGKSMLEAGIDDGDLLVVNRALTPAHRTSSSPKSTATSPSSTCTSATAASSWCQPIRPSRTSSSRRDRYWWSAVS